MTEPEQWNDEAVVQKSVVEYLKTKGYEIRRTAGKKEKGPDIVASKDGKLLVVEVKGYPLKDKYANPKRAGEVKPTNTALQAKHWFAEALTTLLTRRELVETYAVDQSAPLLALALPVEKAYRDRVEAVEWALKKLGVKVLWVFEDGQVTFEP
jgi:Holliday junction resolvase-like predicted endonuclease